MKPKTYHEKFKNRGFTIIEVAVSIFILAVAIIGIYSAFSIVIVLALDNSDRFIASYLAQEGMEIIRNIRDADWIAGNYWGTSFPDECFDNGCEVDYTTVSGGINSWPSVGKGNYLYIDNNGFYSYNTISENPTKFKRKIKIEEDYVGIDKSIMKVSVEVTWDKKATMLNPKQDAGSCMESNCIILEEYMYNWY